MWPTDVGDMVRTRKAGQTDRQTDGQTDGRTDGIEQTYSPHTGNR